MKNMARRIEEMFVEVTFAEEREIRQLKNISDRFTEWIDNHFTAVTFAEVGEVDTARDFMDAGSGGGKSNVGYCLSGFCAGRT